MYWAFAAFAGVATQVTIGGIANDRPLPASIFGGIAVFFAIAAICNAVCTAARSK